MPRLLTIGHSNHPAERFAWLLQRARVEVIADVRSWPHSRHAEWADREWLPGWLKERGCHYVFLGRELGGRPEHEECYDAAGRVLYGRVARTTSFRAGIERLLAGVHRHRVAIMCSEEDPAHCHRRLLVARVVVESGVGVWHIRGNGGIERETGVEPPAVALFDDEDHWWRSTRSVSRRARLSGSSTA